MERMLQASYLTSLDGLRWIGLLGDVPLSQMVTGCLYVTTCNHGQTRKQTQETKKLNRQHKKHNNQQHHVVYVYILLQNEWVSMNFHEILFHFQSNVCWA